MRITTYNMRFNEDRTHMLVKEAATNYLKIDRIENPACIPRLMCDVFDLSNRTEEHVYMLAINSANKLIGVFEISHGGTMYSYCNPREIYSRALLAGAVSIILVHNHPSGDVNPSKSDREATKTIAEAGNLIGIKLMDHIIVGADGKYCSLAEYGEIE